jgi:hypothetical protein
MHVICRVPQDGAHLLLAGLQSLIKVLLRSVNVSQNEIQRLVDQISCDPRSIVSAFNISPNMHPYICCPQCFALYPYEQGMNTQLLCSHTFGNGEACGAKLMRKYVFRGKQAFLPVRKYLHQDMKHWLARLLSRNNLEDIIDNVSLRISSDGVKRDIWDADVVRNFLGSDGKSFFDAPPTEGRYIFGLNIDGFNPYSNKASKKSVSSTAIYMICYNLPPDIRYRRDNMYLVGIIPGKPSKSQFNHFLKILVDDLLPFWNPGVFFSKTFKYPNGRLVRCALIPLICDVVGSRPVAGFRSHNSRWFCTCCYLDLDQIENLDYQNWPPRDAEIHRKHAEMWKNADTVAQRLQFEEKFGVFWSELLRLPYWHPILFTVLDAMHNFYLGLLKNHCRKIWGMDIQVEDGYGLGYTKGKKREPSLRDIQNGKEALFTGKLMNVSSAVLHHFCEALNLRRAGKKKALISELMKWRETSEGQIWISYNASQLIPTADNLQHNEEINIGEQCLSKKTTFSTLSKLKKSTLQVLCSRRGYSVSGFKRDLVNHLLHWVIAFIYFIYSITNGNSLAVRKTTSAY